MSLSSRNELIDRDVAAEAFANLVNKRFGTKTAPADWLKLIDEKWNSVRILAHSMHAEDDDG